MKLVHIPFCFFPEAVGGTEIYVEALAREQREQGWEVLIAAPGERDEGYQHDGIPVRRFPINRQIADLREMYGNGDKGAALRFAAILDEEKPDVVHLHAFTRGVSVRLVREAKRRGIPVLFSYHTPTTSCQRGTLLRCNTIVCEGRLDLHTCARCTLQSQGLSKPFSFLIGSLPPAFGRALGRRGLSGGPWTALRATELIELRHSAFRALVAEVDHIVALCDWVKELLIRNSVSSTKVTVSRQGLCHAVRMAKVPTRPLDGRTRAVFLGRLDPTKGAHVLIEALTAIPAAPIQVDIYGVGQGKAGEEYLAHLRHMAASDRRVHFFDPIPAANVTDTLQQYDLLLVPSQGLETGPMVVLEAFAARIPVFGSNLGGIAELVTHGIDGLLLEAASIPAWTSALERVSRNRTLLKQLRSGVRLPRTIRECADDISKVYDRLVGIRELTSGL